jgi:hypothetical protein
MVLNFSRIHVLFIFVRVVERAFPYPKWFLMFVHNLSDFSSVLTMCR